MRKSFCKPRRPGSFHARPGALLVCVLVCLLVASALVTTMLRHTLRSRREVRVNHQRIQTEFLLDAGILRAARQLKKSPEYVGESWQPSGAIDRFPNAMVEIEVASSEADSALSEVRVTASLGVALQDAQTSAASRTQRTYVFETTSELMESEPNNPTDTSNAE
jgi:hypothetical protein